MGSVWLKAGLLRVDEFGGGIIPLLDSLWNRVQAQSLIASQEFSV